MNPHTTFESLNLIKPVHDALVTMRYKTPTPIQERGIPLIMNGKDLIGIAQTGTGKTAAFGVPMVTNLFNDKNAQGLILVPTRELAMQVYEVMRQLTQNVKSIKTWVIIGGTSMYAQTRSLPRVPRLIIATPGRLMDHLNQKTFHFQNLNMIVLDEADRMLDIGFEPQIRKIFQYIPKKRQTLLFSATFPKTIERLTREYMNHPERLTIGKVSEPAKEIDQSFVQTTVQEKNQLLIRELHARKGTILVFVRTKHKADRVSRLLEQEKFQVDRIHGGRTQGQRTRAMQNFRNKQIRVLVATDVASRGLDISHIEHVINYDIPEIPEDYVHRIGRTARAGAKGESLSFLTPEDKTKWMYLFRHLRALGVEVDSRLLSSTPLQTEAKKDSKKSQPWNSENKHTRRHGRPKHRPAKSRFAKKKRPQGHHSSTKE